eukprot:806793-Rhodomonas_salina.1
MPCPVLRYSATRHARQGGAAHDPDDDRTQRGGQGASSLPLSASVSCACVCGVRCRVQRLWLCAWYGAKPCPVLA